MGNRGHPLATGFCKARGGGVTVRSGRRVSRVLGGLRGRRFRVASVGGDREAHGTPLPFAADALRRRTTGTLGFNARGAVHVTRRLCRNISVGKGKAINIVACLHASSAHVSRRTSTTTEDCVTRACKRTCITRKAGTGSTSGGVRSTRRTVQPASVAHAPTTVGSSLDESRFHLCRLV